MSVLSFVRAGAAARFAVLMSSASICLGAGGGEHEVLPCEKALSIGSAEAVMPSAEPVQSALS